VNAAVEMIPGMAVDAVDESVAKIKKGMENVDEALMGIYYCVINEIN
jgi:hypothetical protein